MRELTPDELDVVTGGSVELYPPTPPGVGHTPETVPAASIAEQKSPVLGGDGP
jgi:hypothetical protein